MPPGSLSEAFALEAARRLLDAGLLRVVTVLTPAAGAEWSQTVPGGATWELVGAAYLLTTSAVVATRTSRLAIVDADGNTIARFQPAGTLAASSNARHFWYSGLGANASAFDFTSMLPAPAPILTPGWTVRSITGSLDAGDAYTQIALTVRELSPAELVQRIDQVQIDLDAVTNL